MKIGGAFAFLRKASFRWATCQGFSPFISARQPSPRVDQRSTRHFSILSPLPLFSSSSSPSLLETSSPNFLQLIVEISLSPQNTRVLKHLPLVLEGKEKRKGETHISFFQTISIERDFRKMKKLSKGFRYCSIRIEGKTIR